MRLPLYTQRLHLRKPKLADKTFLYQLDCNPNVMRYIADGHTKSKKESSDYLERAINLSQDTLGYWIVECKITQTFVGWFVLKPLANTPEIEIGYRIAEQQWGKGYATEGATCLIDYATQKVGLKRIVAVTIAENKASQRVLQKVGFRYEKEAYFYGQAVLYFAIEKIASNHLSSATAVTNIK